MVQLFYPSKNATKYPLAPYAGPSTASYYEKVTQVPNGTASLVETNSHTSAPITTCSSIPAIIFSHGFGSSRIIYTSYYEDLASHGYLVIALDHPYDAEIVEFPDNRTITYEPPTEEGAIDFDLLMDVRVKDTQYTLDLLYTNLTRSIPGVRRRLRIKGVGMLGHSFGGAAAANTMLVDGRVLGGLNLDGSIYGAAATTTESLDGPFVFVGTPDHNLGSDETWSALWGKIKGWKRALVLARSTHGTFSDVGLLAGVLGMPESEVVEGFGTIDQGRANKVVRAYLRDFFEFLLGSGEEGLYEGPDEEYPEITFQS